MMRIETIWVLHVLILYLFFSAIRQYDEDWNFHLKVFTAYFETVFSAIRQYDEDCPSATLRAQSQILERLQISC